MPRGQVVAVVGAGLIGASWAASFLAAGFTVVVMDPARDAERQVRQRLKAMWRDLRTLDPALPPEPPGDHLRFTADLAEAVEQP